jgi:hypothetical protein
MPMVSPHQHADAMPSAGWGSVGGSQFGRVPRCSARVIEGCKGGVLDWSINVPILNTKLFIPPPQPWAVSRPSLIARLGEGMHRKPEAILTNLLNEIATVKDGFVLVLDDYHVIDTRAVDDAITFLLEHLPPRMHLVVATREDPNLPLPRLRARGQLTGTKRTFVVRPVRAPCTAPELSWFWATCHRR